MKKRIRAACFLLFLLWGLFAAGTAQAATKPKIYVSMSAKGDASDSLPPDAVNCWISSSGKGYLFLPSFYKPKRMYMYFNTRGTLTLGKKAIHSGDAVSFSPKEKFVVKGKDLTVTVMQSAPIPAIFINTESGNMNAVHQAKTVKEPGEMYMVDADGTVLYQGGLQYIRSRGNSTFKYPKKAYQIKLETSTSLCGMAKDKTYILLANYLDRSEIRNRIALDIARYSGAYAFTPKCQAVDLYLNHTYAGCYLLTEKCEIGKSRLNITNLEKATEKANEEPLENYPFIGKQEYSIGAFRAYDIPNDPDDITGGYLIMTNNTKYYQEQPSGFVVSRGSAFTIKEPKYASESQVAYISGVMQQIEDALFAEDGRDPATGKHYSELLDMNSFINRYLLAETLYDHDGWRPYYYKDSDAVDSKVYCGPVWDQDNILGVATGLKSANELLLDKKGNTRRWLTQAAKQPDFRAAMMQKYYDFYRHVYLILLGKEKDKTGTLLSIDEYTEEIRASTEMDHIRWNRTQWLQKCSVAKAAGETPDECAAYMKEFILARMKTMDQEYPAPK